ncbi:CAP domain-containing protein [Actinoplanes rectilineatus]|uniref:CAP domain-containing protein n=1 Tax=Actinoplanes rectilineatus TaxID=113571 RepID=UPI0005F2D378|nr:CAP domain-containing protein [Actinoplanes rectilineatus]
MPLSTAARFRYTLVAGSTAVVIGAGFMVAGVASGSTDATTTSPVSAPIAVTTAPGEYGDDGLLTDLDASASISASPSVSASVTPSASASASPKASAKASPTVKKTATTKAKASSSTTKKAEADSAPATSGTVAEQVLAHINAARVDEGLKALKLDTALSTAAAMHTELMMDGCGLEHQCSGESGIGERFTAQAVSWSTAGENIGFGSSGASDAAKIDAANGLTDSMLAEVAPNDGHRKNLLNADFTRIGLSIVRDTKGITWMTQDFVG